MVNLKFKQMEEEVSLYHTKNINAAEDGLKQPYLVYRMERIIPFLILGSGLNTYFCMFLFPATSLHFRVLYIYFIWMVKEVLCDGAKSTVSWS
jgi:hypothetical protein